MCGIGAIINISLAAPLVERSDLEMMSHSMKGRGPDADGIWVSNEYAIGMTCRRLSTQDARAIANQPVFTHDQTVVTVLNGEIYNCNELRDELKKKGCVFHTRSDTEVLANGYKIYGVDVLNKIHGQFAFVAYDKRNHKILIARDRLGICPLYFTVIDNQIIIASTVDAILDLNRTFRSLDHQAVYDFFIMDSVGWEKTFFDNVSYVRAGFCLHFDLFERPCKKRYYSLERDYFSVNDRIDEGEWIEQIRSTLFSSVEECMMGDKEVGVYLSGGIDSVSVMSMIRNIFPDRLVKTFSAGFTHALTGEPIGEIDFAREMAKHFDTNHHEILVTPEDLVNDIGKSPLPPSGMIDTVVGKLAQAAADSGVNVALSGEGSDEIFFGYDHFMAAVGYLDDSFSWLNEQYHLRGNYSKALVPGRSVLEDLFRGGGANIDLDNNRESTFQLNGTIKSVKSLAKLLKQEVIEANPNAQLDKQLIYIDYSQKVPENLLRRAEGPSMGNGVEMRFPFLSDRLIQLLYQMPMHMRIGDGTTKYILRKIMKGIIPAKALNRPKSPFGLPATRREHFKGAGLDFKKPALRHFFFKYYDVLAEVINDGSYRREKIFSDDLLNDLLSPQRHEGSCHFNIFLWKLWNFAAWYNNWISS